MESFEIESFGLSDIGLVRPNNEDVLLNLPEQRFFAVADGMGGHKAGEVAARETLDNLKKTLSKRFTAIANIKISTRELMHDFEKAIKDANAWVHGLGKNHHEYHGMGSTLCCMHITDKHVVYAHVGDSRIYRYRNNELEQLTTDHSLISQWVSRGEFDKKKKLVQSHKNIITKAIGTHSQVQPDVDHIAFEPDDVFFLCTDGLTDYVSISEIEDILSRDSSVEKNVNSLVEIAKQKGSHDNITVLMIRIASKS